MAGHFCMCVVFHFARRVALIITSRSTSKYICILLVRVTPTVHTYTGDLGPLGDILLLLLLLLSMPAELGRLFSLASPSIPSAS